MEEKTNRALAQTAQSVVVGFACSFGMTMVNRYTKIKGKTFCGLTRKRYLCL